MSVRARRQALGVFLSTVLIVVLGLASLVWYIVRFPDRPGSWPARKVSLVVTRGTTLPEISRRMKSRGLVRSALAFRIYVSYRGMASRIRAGAYQLSTGMTPRELLERLVHGVPAETVSVTIPEGSNVLDVARLLDNAGIAPREAVLEKVRDPQLLRRLGVPSDSMEGFLFPDTYKLRTQTPAEKVLEKLFERHRRIYYGLVRRYAKRTYWLRRKLGWQQHEIVTLASIIEKETARASERPLIAAVFFNRLTRESFASHLLQTDPTIIYGCTVPPEKSIACRTFNGRIRRIHLRDAQNPYNTYMHPGLPPGPISNPGQAALEAVFEPAKSPYLYFVSRNDGTHKFSKTAAEHERAVDKYQRRGAVGPGPTP